MTIEIDVGFAKREPKRDSHQGPNGGIVGCRK